MTILKEDLKAALAKLDTFNNDHWTDDGSPRISVVRALAKDDTIVRATLNELVPGFIRPSISPVDKETGDQPGELLGVVSDDLDFDPLLEPVTNGSGEMLSEDEVQAILRRRVVDASLAVTEAQAKIGEATINLRTAQERHAKVSRDLHLRFPPLSFEENIQHHLASQQRQREEAAGIFGGRASQMDTAMGQRNSRGWSRPSRPVQNA